MYMAGSVFIFDNQTYIAGHLAAHLRHIQFPVRNTLPETFLRKGFLHRCVDIRPPRDMKRMDLPGQFIDRSPIRPESKLQHQASTALWKTFLPLRILTPSRSISSVTAKVGSSIFSSLTRTPPC